MKKKKTFNLISALKLPIYSFFAAMIFLGVSCEEQKILENTKWKLECFGNVEIGEEKDVDPKDCTECYTLSFNADGKLFAHSFSNELSGLYSIDSKKFTISLKDIIGTKIGEYFDGIKYTDALNTVTSFSLEENKNLVLYYNNKKNYLQFTPYNQE
ncbi:MAG: META domain-containing protein [Bacteroidales bacterium]|jgi:hypothetical protein|nr:META domain-containing protein [Bacteroidales bacterium]